MLIFSFGAPPMIKSCHDNVLVLRYDALIIATADCMTRVLTFNPVCNAAVYTHFRAVSLVIERSVDASKVVPSPFKMEERFNKQRLAKIRMHADAMLRTMQIICHQIELG